MKLRIKTSKQIVHFLDIYDRNTEIIVDGQEIYENDEILAFVQEKYYHVKVIYSSLWNGWALELLHTKTEANDTQYTIPIGVNGIPITDLKLKC